MRAASRRTRRPPWTKGWSDATREGARTTRTQEADARWGSDGRGPLPPGAARGERRRLLADAHTRTLPCPPVRPAVPTAMLSWSGALTSLAPLLFCLLVLGAPGVDESGESTRAAYAFFDLMWRGRAQREAPGRASVSVASTRR